MSKPWSGYATYGVTMGKWIFWGTLIGLAVGSTSALLVTVNDFMTDTREENDWVIYLLPIGGAIIGSLYRYLGNGSRAGNDLILEYIHGKGKPVPLQMGPLVFISTFITNLLGGSTGREGAAIQMAGSITEAINRVFKINETDRKLLLIAAISGGFGSAFGTPITGVVFGLEVVALGRIRYDAIVPCFTASFVGHYIATVWGIKHEHHVIHTIPEITAGTIGKIMLAAILFSLTSVLYSQLRHSIYNFCKTHLPNLMVRGFLGGTAIIVLYLIVGSKDYLGRGLPMVNKAFEETVPAYAFLAKIIFTSVTMGTGFRGGEVIPLFFIGATLGNVLAPLLDLPVSFLAALGLIGVFCGASQVPLACFLLGMELFEGKGALYFFMVCIMSFLCSGIHGIYPTQTVHEPKSRLFQFPPGQTISKIEHNRGRKGK